MKLQQELKSANEQLAHYAGAGVYRRIDPNLVDNSRFADRDADLMTSGPEWVNWLDLLRASNGNNVPVLVIKRGERYELVYGHRRTRGCQEIGAELLAMIVNDIDPQEHWLTMRRENEGSRPLCVIEVGNSYRLALEQKVFVNAAEIATHTGLNKATISKAIKASQIPEGIYKSLGDWREVTWAQAGQLAEYHAKHPTVLQDRAGTIPDSLDTVTARLHYLLSTNTPTQKPELYSIVGKSGEKIAQLKANPDGLCTLLFVKKLHKKDQEALIEVISKYGISLTD
jgi:ParB family transcriptional regulator, chromosome partitioning protein